MGYPVQQSTTSQPLVFFLVLSSDHITAATGKTPVVTISKNGASFAAPAGGVWEIGNGFYGISGNATDNNTLGPLLVHASGVATDPYDDMFNVVSYNPQSATNLGLSALPSVTAGASGGVPLCGENGGIKLSDQGRREAASGVWTAIVTDYSGINTYGYQLQPIYYADIKQYYDLTNTRDEYSVNWYRGHVALGSGSITNARISVYNTANGTAVFQNADMSFSAVNIGSLRYNDASNILSAGEPYNVMVSGTIDGATRIWQKIIGRNKV